jgi:hypothetical protein
MDFNQSFNAKIPGVDVSEEEAKSRLENFTAQASRSSAPALNIFAQLQQKRAQRLESAAGSLEKVLGTDHPQVAVLKQSAVSAGDFNTYYKAQAQRVEKRPKLRENEWMVYGRVIDATGQPAAGLTVRVFDKDRKLDDLLGITETEESGDFSVVYHARDFFEVGENAPELYLMVEDASGKVLFTSRDSVRPQAGKSEYFTIQLGREAIKSTVKKRGRPPKVAKVKPSTATVAKTTRTAKAKPGSATVSKTPKTANAATTQRKKKK